jgi:hypothetical protein
VRRTIPRSRRAVLGWSRVARPRRRAAGRPDLGRNRPALLLQRHRLRQHRSLLGLESVDHVAARQGLGRIWSTRAHTRSERSFHLHSEHARCGTGVQRRSRPHFPVNEIFGHSNGQPACAIRCTGRTPRDRDRAVRWIGEASDACEAALVQSVGQLAAMRRRLKLLCRSMKGKLTRCLCPRVGSRRLCSAASGGCKKWGLES